MEIATGVKDKKSGSEAKARGGKGRGGKAAGPEKAKVPDKTVITVTTVVEARKSGVTIRKSVKVDKDAHKPVEAASYSVEFPGHKPVVCTYLSEAREKANAGPQAEEGTQPKEAA